MKKNYLCLGNVSWDISANNIKKKTGLNVYEYNFSFDCRAFDTSNIIDIIGKYLMKK